MLGLQLTNISRLEAWILRLLSILVTAGLFFTLSRSAGVALLIGLAVITTIVYIWQSENRKKVLAGVGFILGTLLFLSTVFYQLVLTRAVSETRLEEKSIVERQVLNQDGWEIAKQHFVLGVGVGNMPLSAAYNHPEREPYSIQPSHNIYILALAEVGVIGLLFFLVFIFSPIRFVNFSNPVSIVLLGSLGTLMLIGWFDHYLWTLEPGMLLLLTVWAIAHKPN